MDRWLARGRLGRVVVKDTELTLGRVLHTLAGMAIATLAVGCGAGQIGSPADSPAEPGAHPADRPGADSGLDPGAGAHDAGLRGDPDAALDPGGDASLPVQDPSGSAQVRVDDVTSSSVSLSWSASLGGDGVRIFIAPEPVAGVEDPLPDQLQVADLPAGSATHRITGLAAAVDVFVHVEVYDESGVVAAGNVHARTPGGPQAERDTDLQSVHLYGPDVLLAVFANDKVHSFTTANDWWDKGDDNLYDYTGVALQAGQWSVQRADGSPIAVQAVYRDSLPVASPYQEFGYALNTNDHLLDVQHSIFLKLAEPVGARDVLHVIHVAPPRDALLGSRDAAADFLLPYSDRYLETPAIQLNQVGYNPRASRRYAYVSGWMGDGGNLGLDAIGAEAQALVEAADPRLPRDEVATLPVTLRSSADADSGGEVKQIDLSALPPSDAARYRIRVPGVGVSWSTQVNETALLKAYYVTARGMFYNRWGRDLAASYSDWHTRTPDHVTVFTNDKYPTDAQEWQMESSAWAETDPQTQPRTLQGGHHDAGDFDIRPQHYLVSLELLRAYEVNPGAFADDQLDIPESGNGIPDLLDEVLWSLSGWEQLQEPDGGVRGGAESWRHPWGVYYADQDPLPYFTYARDTQLTARVAGLLAQAAFHVQSFDAARATSLQTHALAAYEFAYAQGLRADDTAQGAGMMYAEGELFRLTGDALHKQRFEAGWTARDQGWGEGGADVLEASVPFPATNEASFLADYALGYLQASGASTSYASQMRSKLSSLATSALSELEANHAHRNGREVAGSPAWGKGTAVGEYVWRLYYQLQFGQLGTQQRQACVDAISLSADYVLGANPLGLVWITGLGSRAPIDPRHSDSRAFIVDQQTRAIPGIPVYGPGPALKTSAAYETANRLIYPDSTLWTDRPLMRRYSSASNYVNMNEFTVQESMAPQTALLGVNLGAALLPPSDWQPGQANHRNPLPTGVAAAAP
jgi:endoglucanase